MPCALRLVSKKAIAFKKIEGQLFPIRRDIPFAIGYPTFLCFCKEKFQKKFSFAEPRAQIVLLLLPGSIRMAITNKQKLSLLIHIRPRVQALSANFPGLRTAMFRSSIVIYRAAVQ